MKKEKITWMKTGKEILELGVTDIPKLLEPIIQKYGVVSLAGSSDLGKSYFLLQLTDAIINGAEEFLGLKLNIEHKSAIYLTTEDDEFALCPRLTKMASKWDNTNAFENLRLLFDSKDLLDRIDTMLTEKPADLVVIDTFTDIYDGDMNQSNKIRSFIQKFKELATKHKTLMIFNHHCGKRNDLRPPHKDNLLGSQGFESSMRTVMELRRDYSNPDIRHLCVVKGNYVDASLKHSSYVLKFDYEGDGFTNTGERVSFDKLAKTDELITATRELTKEKVLALNKEGLSYEKIAKALKEEGIQISKSTVGNICKDNRPSIQMPLDEKMTGQLVEFQKREVV